MAENCQIVFQSDLTIFCLHQPKKKKKRKKKSQLLHHSTALDALTVADFGDSDSAVVSCYFDLQLLSGMGVRPQYFLYSLFL